MTADYVTVSCAFGVPIHRTTDNKIFLHHPLTLQLLTARSTFPKFKTSLLLFILFFISLFCKNLYMLLSFRVLEKQYVDIKQAKHQL